MVMIKGGEHRAVEFSKSRDATSMNAPVMLPKGTNHTGLAIALASSRKDAISARDIAESRWGVASPVAQILRSAVAKS